MKIVSNLKDKMTESKACRWATKAPHNLANVLILKRVVLNKISDKLNISR